jgi:hypothetical protein
LTLNSRLEKSLITNSNQEKTIAGLKLQLHDYEENFNYQQRSAKIKLDAADK